MLDRIKSLLESRKRELSAAPGPDNRAPHPMPEDQAARIQPVACAESGIIVFPVDNVGDSGARVASSGPLTCESTDISPPPDPIRPHRIQ